MSVYSGFCTRQQESLYNKQLEIMIKLITSRLYSFFSGDIVDDISWIEQFVGTTKALAKLEKEKYMAPRFSVLCKGLLDYFLNVAHRNGEFSYVTTAARTPSLQRSVDAYRALSSSPGRREKHSKRRKGSSSTNRSAGRWTDSTMLYKMLDGTITRYSLDSRNKNRVVY